MSKLSSTLVFLGILTAVTLGVYVPGLNNGLVFDDARLTDGSIFYSYGSLLDLRPRMLSYGSFVWVQAIFGEGWWKQRLVNVLLHLGVVASLYVLTRDLLRVKDESAQVDAGAELSERSQRAALRVGVALFALNPVAVYAVAYLVQRSIVMATLFVVVACAAFVRGLVTQRRVWFLGAMVAYVAAVLSKEVAFTAAALCVPLYIFVRRPGWQRSLLVTGAALLIMAAVAAVLLQVYANILGTVFDVDSRLYAVQLEAMKPGISKQLFPLSILNQAALFFAYGFLWLVPNVQWMSVDLRPAFPLAAWALPQSIGAFGFVALIVTSVWLLLKRSGAAAFLGFCLLCPCLLFLSEFVTVWVQDPFVLYRSYLWALTIPGLIALALTGFKPQLIYQVGLVVGLLFAALTFERVHSFSDPFTVWSDAVEKVDLQAGGNAVGRARPFLNRGAHYLERESPELAYGDFERASTLGDTQGAAGFNMGTSLQMLRRHSEALAAFDKAEALGFTEAALYYHRGESLFALGRFSDAFASYTQSLAKAPPVEVAEHTRLRRAEAAVPAGRHADAADEFNALLARKPGDYRLMGGLGMAEVGRGNPSAALPIFDKLLATKPTAGAHYGRAMAHLAAGNKPAALSDLDRAVALEPNNTSYRTLQAQITSRP